MKWGMNVQLDGQLDDELKFLRSCHKAGLRHLRIFIPETITDLKPLVDELEKCEMQAYITLFQAKNTGPTDPLYLAFKNGSDSILERYRQVLSQIPTKLLLGVGLPECIHLFAKTTARSKFGIRRSDISKMVCRIAEVIRESGNTVVFPMRVDDLQGGVWDNCDFDVYDIETMLSAKLLQKLDVKQASEALKKDRPYWFGKTGVLGGYMMPALQAKFLRKIQSYAKGAQYAFLWSEKATEKFHWSVGGEFVVDVLSASLKSLNVEQKRRGNPNLGHWKAQRRKSQIQPQPIDASAVEKRIHPNEPTQQNEKKKRLKARAKLRPKKR